MTHLKYKRGSNEILTENFSEVVSYVANVIKPIQRKTINKDIGSCYKIKHDIESNLGCYISNLDLKVAMALNDIPYQDIKSGESNVYYPLSSKGYRGVKNE